MIAGYVIAFLSVIVFTNVDRGEANKAQLEALSAKVVKTVKK